MQICHECGAKHGNHLPKGAHGVWRGVCDWCDIEKTVTSTRDYGYPELNKDEMGKED